MGINEGKYSGEIRGSDVCQAIETKAARGGGSIAIFRVETTFGRDGVDFAKFTAFGEVADYVARELREGDQVDVEYRVKSHVFDGQNGPREFSDLRAFRVELSDGRGGASNQRQGGGYQQREGGYQQRSQGGGYQQRQGGGQGHQRRDDRPQPSHQSPPPQQARYSRRDEDFDQMPSPQQQRQQFPRQQAPRQDGYDDRQAGAQPPRQGRDDDGRGHPPDMFDPEKGQRPPPPPPPPSELYVPPDPSTLPSDDSDIPF
jgi:single-stranded DNA-binding protein